MFSCESSCCRWPLETNDFRWTLKITSSLKIAAKKNAYCFSWKKREMWKKTFSGKPQLVTAQQIPCYYIFLIKVVGIIPAYVKYTNCSGTLFYLLINAKVKFLSHIYYATEKWKFNFNCFTLFISEITLEITLFVKTKNNNCYLENYIISIQIREKQKKLNINFKIFYLHLYATGKSSWKLATSYYHIVYY